MMVMISRQPASPKTPNSDKNGDGSLRARQYQMCLLFAAYHSNWGTPGSNFADGNTDCALASCELIFSITDLMTERFRLWSMVCGQRIRFAA
jgi:hypothetical protein